MNSNFLQVRNPNVTLKSYLLVHDHTDGTLGDIPHDSSAAVVEFMRHTLVNGTVHLDVHILSDLEVAQVDSQGDVTLVSEGAREQVSRPRAKSMTSRHLRLLLPSLRTLAIETRQNKRDPQSLCESSKPRSGTERLLTAVRSLI